MEQIEFTTRVADAREKPAKVSEPSSTYADEVEQEEFLKILEKEMAEAAERLDFERAALLRDQIFELRAEQAPKRAGLATGFRCCCPTP